MNGGVMERRIVYWMFLWMKTICTVVCRITIEGVAPLASSRQVVIGSPVELSPAVKSQQDSGTCGRSVQSRMSPRLYIVMHVIISCMWHLWEKGMLYENSLHIYYCGCLQIDFFIALKKCVTGLVKSIIKSLIYYLPSFYYK